MDHKVAQKIVKASLADLKLRLGQMRYDRSQKDSSIGDEILEYENRKRNY